MAENLKIQIIFPYETKAIVDNQRIVLVQRKVGRAFVGTYTIHGQIGKPTHVKLVDQSGCAPKGLDAYVLAKHNTL